MKTTETEFADRNYWSEAWKRHIHTYLNSPPRTGHFLKHRMVAGATMLEIAGGSCRDSRMLAESGHFGAGSDFDVRTLQYLRHLYPDSKLPMLQADGFYLPFADSAFDVTFSNGFWVLYDQDQLLYQLLREQARVSRTSLWVIVHNRLNHRLREKFAELAQKDSMYNVRFFMPDEVCEIVARSGIAYRRIAMHKFGGTADLLYLSRISSIPNPLQRVAGRVAPLLYELQPWKVVERVAVEVVLR